MRQRLTQTMTHTNPRPDPRETAWRLSAGLVAVIALAVSASAFTHADRPAPIPTQTININSATPAELQLLQGVGPTLSHRIAKDRAESGPYQSLEDLDRVPRIGERTLRDIAPDIKTKPSPN